jgi:hypothetical protein
LVVEQLEGLVRLLDQREVLLVLQEQEGLLAELLLDLMDQQLVPLEGLRRRLDQRELPLDQREGLLVLQEQEQGQGQGQEV